MSDIRNFSELDIKFELGTPFVPFEQLLAVLPAASRQLLPKPFQVRQSFTSIHQINLSNEMWDAWKNLLMSCTFENKKDKKPKLSLDYKCAVARNAQKRLSKKESCIC